MYSRAIRLIQVAIVCIATIYIAPFAITANLDAPHDAAFGSGCISCHDMLAYDQPNLIPDTGEPLNIDDCNNNRICAGCHDGVTATNARCHSSLTTSDKYGTWRVGCSVCHNQHTQEQDRAFGTNYGKFVRRIINLNRILDNAPPLGVTVSGKNGFQTVSFVAETGSDSFVDSDATFDDICRVCHTKTNHFRNTGEVNVTSSGYDHSGTVGTDCMDCHDHANGFAHGSGYGTGCVECHGHDPGTVYDSDMTAPYVPDSSASPGRGTYQSHSTHTETDTDDLKGPEIYCADCHDINNFPFFKSGVDGDGDGKYNLTETDVCDACHSEGGTYKGLSDPVVGAKTNWRTSIYDHDGGNPFTLQEGKEKWCATCHDETPSQIRGIDAPNIAGDESGAYTYGTGWGYYKTGHGLKTGDTYPSSGGMVSGAGKECSACHDYSQGHVDGLARTFDCSDGCNPTEYRQSYRLKLVDGVNPPMVIPRPVLGLDFIAETEFRLCFTSGCHSPDKFTSYDVRTTNFRDATHSDHYEGGLNHQPDDPAFNLHAYHLRGNETSRFYPDWSGGTESQTSCITCHNVHGSSQLAMVRDGSLNGKANGMEIYYNSMGSADTLAESTVTYFSGPSSANLCETCHYTANYPYTRTPLTQEIPTLAWTGEVGYTADGVNPDSGPASRPFVFRVRYTDASSEAPKYIQVWIDEDDSTSYEESEKYDMAAVDPSDMDYTDGKLYRKTVILRPGNHTYRFYGRDTKFEAIDDPSSPGDPVAGSTVNVTNTAPGLSWTGELGYTAEGVSPDSGTSGSNFEFRVTYTDVNNDCPVSGSPDIQVWIDEDDIPGDGTSYADPGERFNMSEADATDTDCTDGKVYSLTRTLTAAGDGTLSYRFFGSDGIASATGIPTSTNTVTISSSNSAPVLSWTGEAGYIGDGVSPDSDAGCVDFEFRVTYADVDNECPTSGSSDIQVWIDQDNTPGDGSSYAGPGEKFNLIEADAGDRDCTDGKVYTLTKTIPYAGSDNIHYRFYATDGALDATGAPVSGSTVAVSYANGRLVPSVDYPKIQDAINAAVDGDIVCVDNGTYSEQINFSNKAITVKSINGADVTMIEGNGANAAVVYFSSGEGAESILDGFTINNQLTGSVTRGIVITNSSPTIRNSIIQGNVMTSANTGAGIYIGGGAGGATIEKTVIGGSFDPETLACVNKNQTQNYGGGLSYQNSTTGTLVISDSLIQCNTAVWNGGGIYLNNNSNSTVISNTVISKNNVIHRFGGGVRSDNAPLSVIDSHIDNNVSSWSGGGLILTGSGITTTIENSTVSENSTGWAGAAGAIYLLGTNNTLEINNSTIADNATDSFGSGGLKLEGTSQNITIRNSTIKGNYGREGGGINFSGSNSKLLISDSNLSSNIGFFGPGGLKALGGTKTNMLTVERTVIAGNHAQGVGGSGGGLHIGSAAGATISATFNNCMVTGNRGSVNGGGFWVGNAGTTVDITNCTMSGNYTQYGGAIYNSGAALTVNNSIMWGDKHGFFTDPSPEISDGSATATITHTNIRQSGYAGNGNMNVDPLFVDPRDYSLAPTTEGDYHLLPDSPLIDKGSLTAHPGNDIDGQPRPLGGNYDLGADEVLGFVIQVTKEADTNGTCDPDDCSLREAVAAANVAPSPVYINIPEGDYAITRTGIDDDNTNGDFDVSRSTALLGAGESLTTIIGVAGDRVFDDVGAGVNLSLSNMTITGGSLAGADGGCVYGNDQMSFYKTTFDNCDARNGGAIFGNISSTVGISNSTFNNNDASGAGGAVRIYGGWIKDSVFNANTAAAAGTYDGGGAVFSSDNPLYISGYATQFTNNNAVNRHGGAVLSQANLSVTGATFDTNTAAISGGAVYTGTGPGCCTTDVVDAVFSDNTANDTAGAIFSQEAVNVTLSGFTGNTSTNAAGAIYSDQNIAVNSSTFSGNTSQQDKGGAIFTKSTAKADRSTFNNNSAYGDGGAVWSEGVALYNSTFSANTSLEFTPSTTDSRGGAVFHNNGASCTIKNATFYGNSAVDDADSLWSTSCVIRNTLFDNSSTTTADNNNNCNSATLDRANSIENNNSAIDSCGIGQSDPQLAALANNGGRTETHALPAGSPAIDTGDDAICADTDINNMDQRGQTRPADGDGDTTATCDTGAFEYIP